MTTSPALALWEGDRQYWLAAVAACIGTVIAMGEGGFGPLEWTLLPVVAAGFLAKARWSHLPNAVFALPALVIPLVMNLPNSNVEFAMFLLALAVILLAKVEHDRRIANGYVAVAVVFILVLGITGVYDIAWPNWVAALGLSWAFGTAVHRYEGVLVELHAAQAERIDHATLVERRRIARDVHDLIGHSLSVVMLHIGGARRLVRTDPDEAEAALLQAEAAGRASMAEVRRTVGLMRERGDDDATAPAPTLADITEVVRQYREAGIDVAYAVTGPTDGVDGGIAVAVHRIAQEALANVARHAPGATVTVTLTVDQQSCRLVVENRRAPAGGGTARRGAEAAGAGAGHGLIGMRERALSAGGSLIAGPVDDGWSVDAVFPLESASAS
ncbi:MAG: histidine kinase [Actinomycetota bacterium]